MDSKQIPIVINHCKTQVLYKTVELISNTKKHPVEPQLENPLPLVTRFHSAKLTTWKWISKFNQKI